MKENKYDEENFFSKYSAFPRSVEGLNAAGEWHELQKMLPDLNDKRVLDIGCGFGWHCRYAAENGASYVLGIDLSEKMLAEARKTTESPIIEYQRMAMEDIHFPPDTFDIVLSSLALHYTSDYHQVCKQINECLSESGLFVFSVEHPIFTAYGTQDWYYSENKERLHWPVDRYFDEGKRYTNFLGEEVIKYHRTLTTYLNTLLETGFEITKIIEPKPAEHLLDTVPEMRDELRRPMMLLVSVRKIYSKTL